MSRRCARGEDNEAVGSDGGFEDGIFFARLTEMPARAKAKPIRVLIADDHALFREDLNALLSLESDGVKVVGEVERADDLAPALARTPCDVLLLDLQMDRSMVSDIESLARITKVIVLTGSERIEDMVAAFRSGARASGLRAATVTFRWSRSPRTAGLRTRWEFSTPASTATLSSRSISPSWRPLSGASSPPGSLPPRPRRSGESRDSRRLARGPASPHLLLGRLGHFAMLVGKRAVFASGGLVRAQHPIAMHRHG